MSERTRAQPGLRSSVDAAPSAEDVRRKLEGRLERVEAARGHYAALESVLGARRWKRRLRGEHALVAAVLAGEPALAEAVERIHRRAQAEAWPETTPALVAARDVTARRARLITLARGRLASLARPEGEPSLEADLPRLEALVSQPTPHMPAEGEVRLMEQRKEDPNQGALLVRVLTVMALAVLVVPLATSLGGDLGIYAGLVAFFAPLISFAVQSGELWLTSDRLVWKNGFGQPVAVPLKSIHPGGIHANRLWGSVRVEGERTLRLHYVSEPERLAALLEMHRQPPFLDSSRAGLKLGEVSLYPVVLREGRVEKKGWAVLRPRSVVFLPEGTGAEVFRAVTGTLLTPGLRMEVEWVLEQLRWLPEEEFDAAVERAAVAVGGERWSVWDTEYRKDVPVWRDIRLTHGTKVLSGKVDWSQQAPAEKVLVSWAR